ncbi:flavin reductase family protein [Enterovirga aerilata]|uniref:Flavin reductase family protein n=1 Tax=Enterovirga aerilata TaxID=2730920 RepID=A0A849I9U1_9HYPH|nr:flavin reductase family protein [Enterovirga sp. DB1703]NNM74158.1 flavin reductase family protein [Enterovirga sp. DB1703]
MFYRPGSDDHGLARDPFKACITPRPIGWISTVSAEGVCNLSPYSFFNAVSEDPAMVMVCVNGFEPGRTDKDTGRNIVETGEFVVNVCTWALREAMNATCAPFGDGVDEFAAVGIETAPSRLVAPPRVRMSPIALECVLDQTVKLPDTRNGGTNTIFVGRVVGIEIADDVISDGRVDIERVQPIGRLGYSLYTVARGSGVFEMRRPN